LQKASYTPVNTEESCLLLTYRYLRFIDYQKEEFISKFNPIFNDLKLSFFDLDNYYSNDNNIFNNYYNKIITRDYYFELAYYYQRRFNNISYFFNPYLEVFNNINKNLSVPTSYEPSYHI
jgi:hypothetical protein